MSRSRVFFNSADGILLEGLLESPQAGNTGAGVVICHPHSLYGGDMYNNVVTSISGELSRNGIYALSFNFRGVGQSEGSFADGAGEAEDTLAALHFLSSMEEIDSLRVGLAGYSFGGMIALNACEKSDIPAAIAVISPLVPRGVLRTRLIPKLIISGEKDNIVPRYDIEQGFETMAEPKKHEIIPGADHFWGGREKEMAEMVVRFFKENLVEDAGDE